VFRCQLLPYLSLMQSFCLQESYTGSTGLDRESVQFEMVSNVYLSVHVVLRLVLILLSTTINCLSYRLDRKSSCWGQVLGRGGFGEVFAVRLNGTDAVVKRLLPGAQQEEVRKRR
jgi:hypothetical protein